MDEMSKAERRTVVAIIILGGLAALAFVAVCVRFGLVAQ